MPDRSSKPKRPRDVNHVAAPFVDAAKPDEPEKPALGAGVADQAWSLAESVGPLDLDERPGESN